MSVHRRTARPYRGGKRVTAARSSGPTTEKPVPNPGEPGGPGHLHVDTTLSNHGGPSHGLDLDLSGAAVGYTELARLVEDGPGIIDLSNRRKTSPVPHPSIGRTRRITRQLLEGDTPAQVLYRRKGISREVADAVGGLVDTTRSGTGTRPNARRGGFPLTFALRLERDREALYRGAYLLKAAERVQQAVNAGTPIKVALNRESRFYVAHEKARRGRLESVARTQKVAAAYGEQVKDPNGANRTLVGWYLNPLLNNDPECVTANEHNFYAEEGTMIGFPGAVHLGCGCVAGPPIAGAGMVNDALRGSTVPLEHIGERPRYTKTNTMSARKRTA